MSKLSCLNFDSNCAVIKRNVISNDEYSVTIRTKIEIESNYSNACDEWVHMFLTSTKTNWIVKSTFPNKIIMLIEKTMCVSILQKIKVRILLKKKIGLETKTAKLL